jgi:hypothetical protein
MTYGAAAALQAAVYQRLTTFPALAGVAVVDAIPSGTAPGNFVLIGPEVVTDQSDKSGAGAEHSFDVAVISDATGFLTAKTIAGAVSDALVDADLTLGSGALVSLRFQRAVARRIDQGDVRRIDLSFRARIEI